MPRVRFNYVVSFSSEDPDNQANNLLANEISKKKWLCSKGELSCSVVLQMTKAVKISAVHIGAYQASLVEVLVGRSESPNEPYQVLVASNVFLSPSESRREQSVERVRSFTTEQLSSPARDQRWDRLRVVCSQPYNKHCKYGLSFVHVFEPEGAEVSHCPAAAVPSRLLNLDTFSSDEDDFRPGELFVKHLENSQDKGNGSSTTTEVQIRQATSQALRNISDSATKLKKTSTPKHVKHSNIDIDQRNANRDRDSLLYGDDDEKPNAKVDRIVQRHNHNKMENECDNVNKTTQKENKIHKKIDPDLIVKKQERHKNSEHKHKPVEKQTSKQTTQPKKSGDENATNNKTDVKEIRKRTYFDVKRQSKGSNAGVPRAGPVTTAPHELFRGMVLVLSGYENPRRASIRTSALALGAACRADWDNTCTHLICAFPNTPKLRAVRARAGGGAVPAVRADWVEQCAARRRLLPWQWFATEDAQRLAPDDLDDGEQSNSNSECDTDDEIEKVLQKQKKQRIEESPRQKPERSPREGDAGETEPDTEVEEDVQIEGDKALPEFFEGLTFSVRVESAGDDVTRLERYVCAYGGLLLHDVQVNEGCNADYVITETGIGTGQGGRGSHLVTPEWLWKCHKEQRLCPPDYT